MTKSIFKALVLGILVGAGAFFMPKVLVGILVIGFLMRLFCCGGRGHGCCNTQSSCGCGCGCNCGKDCQCGPDCKCGCKTESKCDCNCDSKKEESK